MFVVVCASEVAALVRYSSREGNVPCVDVFIYLFDVLVPVYQFDLYRV